MHGNRSVAFRLCLTLVCGFEVLHAKISSGGTSIFNADLFHGQTSKSVVCGDVPPSMLPSPISLAGAKAPPVPSITLTVTVQ